MAIELYKNSLITLEDAKYYFEERYDSKEWFELEEKEKENILIFEKIVIRIYIIPTIFSKNYRFRRFNIIEKRLPNLKYTS